VGSFADLRDDVAAALTEVLVDHPDWAVHPLPVDALDPPAYLLEWSDPWVPSRSTVCRYDTAIEIRCVGARIDPSPGLEVLELMVEEALLALDGGRFPFRSVLAPRPFTIGGVQYLAATILLGSTVSITKPAPPPQDGRVALVAYALLSAAGATGAPPTWDGAAILTAHALLAAAGASAAPPTSDGAATMTATAALSATGAVTAPAFSPADLPGLVGWWDASDLATITAAGGKVSQWANKKAGGPAATQGTGTAQPATGTRTLNGLNTLDFSGASQSLALASNPCAGAPAGTALYVVALDADPGAGGGVLGGWGTPGSGSHFPYTDGNIYDTFGSTTQKVVGNPVPSLVNPHVYSVVSAAGDWRAYLDGASLFTTAANAVGWGSTLTSVGRADDHSAAFFLDGRIAEIIVCAGALSTADRQAAEAYLKAKWATP
jgi:hypothetical protein